MIEHPNSLLLHHCLQAASAGDRQTLRALWADDIVWHVMGTDETQGELKGADEIFEYLADLGELGGIGLETEVEDILISHRRAAVVCRSQATRGDLDLDARFLIVATIEDRRIQRLMSLPMDPAPVEAFWTNDAA
ncbi:MAG: nuclear transport factor 2 family protein [Myxococcota bacterium]